MQPDDTFLEDSLREAARSDAPGCVIAVPAPDASVDALLSLALDGPVTLWHPAEGVALAVIAPGFQVLVAFVGGDDDGDAGMVAGAHAFEDVRGAHDIGGEGFLRLLVGAADERLRGEMEDDARTRGGEGGADGFRIADIGDHVVEALG